MLFERKSIRRIFGPKIKEQGGYEIRSNREPNTLFNDVKTVSVVRSRNRE